MSGLEDMDNLQNAIDDCEDCWIDHTCRAHTIEKLGIQYTGVYGPFVSGDYAIGDTIAVPGTSGEVIWSYQSKNGLTYVVDDATGWPVEVQASEVITR